MDLTDATVLITGANRGQGRAFAERLAREPLGLLMLGARDTSDLTLPTPPARRGARRVEAVQVDVGTLETVRASFGAIAAATGIDDGGVDVLVNNAGQLELGLLEQQDPDRIESMLYSNLVGPIQLTRLCLTGMVARDRGLVVNNASISGYAFFPGASTYAASKAGMVGFSEALRRELDPTGVDVLHLVTPRVETDMAKSLDRQYDGMVDTTKLSSTTPEDWANKVIAAMVDGDSIVGPGGNTALAKLASRMPAAVLDAVSRRIYDRSGAR